MEASGQREKLTAPLLIESLIGRRRNPEWGGGQTPGNAVPRNEAPFNGEAAERGPV